MKEQYVGDINDYRKYALLRILADGGKNKIGVCWMLTPPDGRTDGNKVEYLSQPEKWRHLDPELFDLLRLAVHEPDNRRLRIIEESGAIPNARYFNEMLPDDRAGRRAYFDELLVEFADCDLIFFDPDNGLEVLSIGKGLVGSSKYLYEDEVAEAWRREKSLLIYQHFPREKRDRFIQRKTDDLRRLAPGGSIHPFCTANVVFFLVAQERNAGRFSRLLEFISSRTDSIAQVRLG